MPHSPETAPWAVRRLTFATSRRYPRLVGSIRTLVALWLTALGALLCSIDDWPGALLFVAAGLMLVVAWADFWIARHVPRS